MGIAMLIAAAAQAAAPQPTGIEIRFCPSAKVRSYPLDSLRGVQSLLLQNAAVVNVGTSDLSIDQVVISLANKGQAIDSRTLGAEQIAAAVRGGAAIKASGMMDLAAFQFCDGKLLNGAALAGPSLHPGQALLLMQNVFAWKGARTDLKVEVRGHRGDSAVTAVAGLPIDPSTSKTELHWPLPAGRSWLVGSGASFHTTHRWAIPEEFALDIVELAPNGTSHKPNPARNSDFAAYGADVLAAADGNVVKVVTGASEEPPMLRKPGEAMDAYYGRISARQAGNLAKGEVGMIGEGVIIDHGNSEFTVYAHLVPGSVRVKVGDHVHAGQPIAKLGSSGNSTEPHLHFQLCDAPSGMSCAGIPPTFVGIDLPNADGPRPIQSGDIVRVAN